MKTIALSILIGALALGRVTPVQAQTVTTPTKYYVRVQGHIAPLNTPFEATLTFDKPVQLPKVTLAAGTYLFTLITPGVMRVSSESGSKVYTVFNTAPSSRKQKTNYAQLRFEQMAPGEAPKLIGLYPEGAIDGYQPVYPKAQRTVPAPVATSGVKK